jgi:uncharacterized SAM-binding protein YcdF (DUF218 family)
MFFYASKVVWYVLQPSSMLLLLFIAGLLFYRFGWRRTGGRILVFSVALYAIAGLSPLANIILWTLEGHYARPVIEDLDRLDGMIVLGGVVDTMVSEERGEVALTEAAERLTEAAALAVRFPNARIVVSGGDGALLYGSSDEATLAKRFLTRLGIDGGRVSLETASRTTWENAVFTKKLVEPKPGERWLLITSAFHMPRASGVFRAADFDITPWPVDFRTRGPEDAFRFSPRPSTAWRRIDLAVKEWVGYLAYYVTGRLK